MRRILLVFLAVFLAAALAAIPFFFAPEDSRAAPSHSEGGPSQGTFTQGATAGPNEPSLVDGSPPKAAELDKPLMTTERRFRPYQVVRAAKRHIGTRYRYSACSAGRMSCTCLTKKTWARFGHKLPMTERGQWRYDRGHRVWKKSNLRRGDIVFFREAGPRRGITHVGIYSGKVNGNRTLVHASAYFGKVVQSQMRYIHGYTGARRLSPR
jgi:cell wall-associated NlpC family hydrolase